MSADAESCTFIVSPFSRDDGMTKPRLGLGLVTHHKEDNNEPVIMVSMRLIDRAPRIDLGTNSGVSNTIFERAQFS